MENQEKVEQAEKKENKEHEEKHKKEHKEMVPKTEYDELNDHYKRILAELDNHFQDKEEKAFVLNKFQELSMMFMDVIDRLTFLTDIRVKEVEEKQKVIEDRIEIVKKAVDRKSVV